jgi:hypothetical protein
VRLSNRLTYVAPSRPPPVCMHWVHEQETPASVTTTRNEAHKGSNPHSRKYCTGSVSTGRNAAHIGSFRHSSRSLRTSVSTTRNAAHIGSFRHSSRSLRTSGQHDKKRNSHWVHPTWQQVLDSKRQHDIFKFPREAPAPHLGRCVDVASISSKWHKSFKPAEFFQSPPLRSTRCTSARQAVTTAAGARQPPSPAVLSAARGDSREDLGASFKNTTGQEIITHTARIDLP